MNFETYFEEKIKALPNGRVFTISELEERDLNNKKIYNCIYKKIKNGDLKRLKNGVYYKPQKSKFGEIKPSVAEYANLFLKEKNQRIGYVTGVNLFNRLGLTTQIANTIEIATNKDRKSKILNGIKIKFKTVKFEIKEENVKELEILDAIKYINKIPDSNKNEAEYILKYLISQITEKEIKILKKLANDNYPKYVNQILMELCG